jgi:hypothetical protein
VGLLVIADVALEGAVVQPVQVLKKKKQKSVSRIFFIGTLGSHIQRRFGNRPIEING